MLNVYCIDNGRKEERLQGKRRRKEGIRREAGRKVGRKEGRKGSRKE